LFKDAIIGKAKYFALEIVNVLHEGGLVARELCEFDAAHSLVLYKENPNAHLDVVINSSVQLVLAVERELHFVLVLVD